ncbi:chitin deacetylase [Mycena latifolia]|nr:chitin deacetylase [Mycena latifolia]
MSKIETRQGGPSTTIYSVCKKGDVALTFEDITNTLDATGAVGTFFFKALSRIIGVKPGFMRPPYGNYNDLVRQASYIRNQSLVLWDFDFSEPSSSKKPLLLPYAISKLKGAGYKLVSVATCLGLPPYVSVGTPQTPSLSWTC